MSPRRNNQRYGQCADICGVSDSAVKVALRLERKATIIKRVRRILFWQIARKQRGTAGNLRLYRKGNALV